MLCFRLSRLLRPVVCTLHQEVKSPIRAHWLSHAQGTTSLRDSLMNVHTFQAGHHETPVSSYQSSVTKLVSESGVLEHFCCLAKCNSMTSRLNKIAARNCPSTKHGPHVGAFLNGWLESTSHAWLQRRGVPSISAPYGLGQAGPSPKPQFRGAALRILVHAVLSCSSVWYMPEAREYCLPVYRLD